MIPLEFEVGELKKTVTGAIASKDVAAGYSARRTLYDGGAWRR